MLSRLSEPIYPPLARQAHIDGDVALDLAIQADGSIESVELIKGHPLLRQSALESARLSQFQCLHCDRTMRYPLTYRFELIPLDHSRDCLALTDEERNSHPPAKLDVSAHEVTVFAKVAETCDPAARTVRSLKCLYLWHCGWRPEN